MNNYKTRRFVPPHGTDAFSNGSHVQSLERIHQQRLRRIENMGSVEKLTQVLSATPQAIAYSEFLKSLTPSKRGPRRTAQWRRACYMAKLGHVAEAKYVMLRLGFEREEIEAAEMMLFDKIVEPRKPQKSPSPLWRQP